jgi:tRNA A-37 threonylcarbamoyl transferase component Bud32
VMALASRVETTVEPAIVPPVAACLDAAGCPAVLSAFRRGLPIVQSVRARLLRADLALALLDSLGQTLDRWHRAGLAHGSLVAGNVLVEPDGSAAFLVDFGLAALFGQTSGAEAAAMDRAGLNALASVLRTSRPTPIASAS